MFSTELKERTRGVHAAVEKALVSSIKRIGSKSDYVRLLTLLYGFYSPVQQCAARYMSGSQHADLRLRQPEKIKDDIQQLTGSMPVFGFATQLPLIENYPSALGALYVLEGSTLGGRIIAKIISRQLGLPAAEGFSFFNAYGDETESMWESFRALLNLPSTENDRDEIAASAAATFLTFKNWIEQHEPAAHQ